MTLLFLGDAWYHLYVDDPHKDLRFQLGQVVCFWTIEETLADKQ